MKRKIIPILIAVVCFVAAVIIMLYPIISSYINEKYRSEIHTAYEEKIELTDDSELEAALEQAIAYNKTIVPGSGSASAYNKDAIAAAAQSYESQLNIAGNGIMAYLEIPKINVYLPVYHNTDDETLERGVGHLLGSSLPVGGEDAHTVLSGHSGMASQKMLTDLGKLEQGDLFFIHVLDKVLAYTVTEQYTVLPHDTSHLGIVQGADLCTLITCVPIGINSHRLLVRGARTTYTEAQEEVIEIQKHEEPAPSDWENQYKLGLLLGVWAVAIIALIVLIWKQYKRLRSIPKKSKGGKYLRKGKQARTPLLKSLRQSCSYQGRWL